MSAGTSPFDKRQAQIQKEYVALFKKKAKTADAVSLKKRKLAVYARLQRLFKLLGEQREFASCLSERQLDRFITLCHAQMKKLHVTDTKIPEKTSILSTNAMKMRSLSQTRTPPDLGGTSSVHFTLSFMPPDQVVYLPRAYSKRYVYISDVKGFSVLKIHAPKLMQYSSPYCIRFGQGDEVVYMNVTTTTYQQIIYSFAHPNGETNHLFFHNHTLQAEGADNILILVFRLMEMITMNVGGMFQLKMDINANHSAYLCNFVNAFLNEDLLFELTCDYIQPLHQFKLLDHFLLLKNKTKGAIACIEDGDYPDRLRELVLNGLDLNYNILEYCLRSRIYTKEQGRRILNVPSTLIAYAVYLHKESAKNRIETIRYLLSQGAVSHCDKVYTAQNNITYRDYEIAKWLEENSLFDSLDYRFVRLPMNLRETKKSHLVGLMNDLTEKSVLSCNIRDELENRDSLSRPMSELFILFSQKYRRVFYSEYIRCSFDAKLPDYEKLSVVRAINLMLHLKVMLKKADLYQYSPLLIDAVSTAHSIGEIASKQAPLPKNLQDIRALGLTHSFKSPPKADPMSGRVYVRDSEYAFDKDKPFSWPQIVQAHYSVESSVIDQLVAFFRVFDDLKSPSDIDKIIFEYQYSRIHFDLDRKFKLAFYYITNDKSQEEFKAALTMVNQVFKELLSFNELSEERFMQLCLCLSTLVFLKYDKSYQFDIELVCFKVLSFIPKNEHQAAYLEIFNKSAAKAMQQAGFNASMIKSVDSIVFKRLLLKSDDLLEMSTSSLSLIMYLRLCKHETFRELCQSLKPSVKKLKPEILGALVHEIYQRDRAKKIDKEDMGLYIEFLSQRHTVLDQRSVALDFLRDRKYSALALSAISLSQLVTLICFSSNPKKERLKANLSILYQRLAQEQWAFKEGVDYVLSSRMLLERAVASGFTKEEQVEVLDRLLSFSVEDTDSRAILLLYKLKLEGFESDALYEKIKHHSSLTYYMAELLASYEIDLPERYRKLTQPLSSVPMMLAIHLFIATFDLEKGLEAFAREYQVLQIELEGKISVSEPFEAMKQAYLSRIRNNLGEDSDSYKSFLNCLESFNPKKLSQFVLTHTKYQYIKRLQALLRVKSFYFEAKAAAALIQGAQNQHVEYCRRAYTQAKMNMAKKIKKHTDVTLFLKKESIYAARSVISGEHCFMFLNKLDQDVRSYVSMATLSNSVELTSASPRGFIGKLTAPRALLAKPELPYVLIVRIILRMLEIIQLHLKPAHWPAYNEAIATLSAHIFYGLLIKPDILKSAEAYLVTTPEEYLVAVSGLIASFEVQLRRNLDRKNFIECVIAIWNSIDYLTM